MIKDEKFANTLCQGPLILLYDGALSERQVAYVSGVKIFQIEDLINCDD
jgi:hypothetical protein